MNSTNNALLSDVNLSGVSFAESGRTLIITLSNMVDGRRCAQLITEGVLAFNYHNTFEDDDDALPTYVGEVTCRALQKEELDQVLLRLGYGFLGPGVKTYVPKSRCFHVHVEGGALAIDVICTEYTISRETA